MNTRRAIYRNQNKGGKWWGHFGPFACGGNGPESVKNISQVAYGVILPTACIITGLGLLSHFGKLWISSKYSDKKAHTDPDNPQSPSPIDEEKAAKEKDQEVKYHICEILGLFNPAQPQPTSLNSKIEDGSDTYKPLPLVGTLFKRGDRAVVVSPPGVGKSIFCWQTGIAVSEGRCPEYLPQCSDHAAPQKVFIYDGELDDDDVKQRYGRRKYSDNLVRYPASKFRTVYYLLQHIYDITVGLAGDATFILDNLYALMPTMTTEETRIFLDGLDSIQRKALENGHRITIIIVTHTVKDVNGIPRLKDVAGSAHISRFAKSELSLAALPGKDNQVALVTNKKRYSNKKDACIIELQYTDYLHFKFVRMTSNSDIENLFQQASRKGANRANKSPEHTTTNVQSDDLVQRMRDLRSQGCSDRQISEMTGVSAPTVRKMIGSNGNGHHNGGRGAHKH